MAAYLLNRVPAKNADIPNRESTTRFADFLRIYPMLPKPVANASGTRKARLRYLLRGANLTTHLASSQYVGA